MERSDNTPTEPAGKPAKGEKKPKRDHPRRDDEPGGRGYYSGVRLPDEPADT